MKKSFTAVCATVSAIVALTMSASIASASPTEGIIPETPLIASHSASDAQIRSELNTLAGTQTKAQIDDIQDQAAPGREVAVLLDVASGKIVAATTAEETKVQSRAISPVGPGCSTTSMCLTQTGPQGFYGYMGTGTRSVNIPRVSKVFAGDRDSGFEWGSKRTDLQKNISLYTSGGSITIKKVIRW